jgi:hypothetical protein
MLMKKVIASFCAIFLKPLKTEHKGSEPEPNNFTAPAPPKWCGSNSATLTKLIKQNALLSQKG